MIKEEAVGMVEHENPALKAEKTTNPTGGFEEENEIVMMEKDLWQPENDLLDMNDASIFYDDFPPLPDFPCMSSSSSSSSAPAVVKPTATATSYSSSASSSVMKSNAADDHSNTNQMQANLSSTASMEIPLSSDHDGVDCIDVMENFGYMDLIDSYDIWDPSSVFQNENPQDFMEDQQAAVAAPEMGGQKMVQREEEEDDENENGLSFIQENGELALIFFEWLKQNKDYISAEDMRSIKLKRSTIESASKRLGSTKEGKKQLLKLILGWVEQCQLSKKKTKETAPQTPYPFQQESVHNPDFNPSPNPNFTYTNTFAAPDPNTCYPASPWMPPPPPPHVPDAAAMVAAPQPAYSYPVAGYNNVDPYLNPVFAPPVNQVVNGIPYPHSGDQYPMMDNTQSWAPSPFPMPPPPPPLPQYSPFCDTGNVIPYQQAFYGHPYPIYDPNGERIVRLGSSATKEARKKRMARQRRHYTHHHRHHSNSYQHQGQMDDSQYVGEGGENCDQGEGDWAYWSPGASSSPSRAGITPPVDASQPHSGDRAPGQSQNNQRPSDRRPQQGWKTEKNLKFLLQKVLKQSDVGNLGRIVLPKKEAESHLPELESRDGIPIAMEDIGTSRVWNMRYRFWPNNKSRMYLLENTGDFVRVNGLQEGDFIVIYSDTKCGKYMIRGVKVRQPGAKLEGKKMSRRNGRSLSLAGNSSSLAPIKQAVR